MSKLREFLMKYGPMVDGDHHEKPLFYLLDLVEMELGMDLDFAFDDETGYTFHKMFRQQDIMPNAPQVDMAIWNLIQNAPKFWSLWNPLNT